MYESERRVYLDHAATSPVLPGVVEVVAEAMTHLGNPSSLHAAGRQARKMVEESRETVAAALGARPSEVVFTSGGTEADNLAVKGLYWSRRSADERRVRILASAVEHHAVLDTVQWLGDAQGARIEWLPVDATGRLDVDALRVAIERDPDSVALVTVMWANNEVGTLQPIDEVSALAREHGIPFHTDAVQAVGQVPVNFSASGADTMTISGHKIGGPMGVGALLLQRDVELTPVLHGGGQERDVRSGTLDTPSYAGLATAVATVTDDVSMHARELGRLRDELVRRVRDAVPDVVYNGDPSSSLPSIAHLSFPGCEGDSLLLLLDAMGIHCSTGSACSTGVPRPSHVLLAMGIDEEVARASLRFSLGRTSTQEDVDAVAGAIGPVTERARAAGMVGVR
ncbi:cysteine desulfurase [Actinobacteria bacterium YIM 96077]|uniref:Cysteine desulfurase NifS n=1 Tax=Phytoactinopolyspora halophila TaxID=1981511 RepID=A0A329QJE8_9ACTN|nr:cysteine desulfurase family protein [Phytoactinopolyspora halophila]AYY12381.1 cysteine desulfurase [Actinobacteria bacterium YIM 96077]RAW12041.1 cysteine desulfurase NifS [Phytoactinopolyspora halophila]